MTGPADTVKTALARLWEALAPKGSILARPEAGVIAGTVLAVSWLALKRGLKVGATGSLDSLAMEDTRLIARLRRERYRLRKMLEALESAGGGDPLLQERIRSIRSSLENVEEALMLVQVRLMAVEKLKLLGEAGLIRNVEDLVRSIYNGDLEDAQYEALVRLERILEEERMKAAVLRRIVEEA
ncbi:MAG: hypothetical protein LRS48_05150 [Desulfurococcales archaeon]|nr:hypothetical protein [Desulfurococcales archaeon]